MKLLPSPQFPIMSQQEIILANARLEAEERYYRTKAELLEAKCKFAESDAALRQVYNNPEEVLNWAYHCMNHNAKWRRYCIESNHPDYTDDKPF